MTEHVNTGGPAFPCECENDGREAAEGFNHDSIPAGATCQYRGMTMRDYFAAKAMNGFLVGDAILKESDTSEQWIEKTAFASYQMADAMLRARESVKAQQSEAQDAVPMQPVVISANGCVRFKENRIVSALLDHGEKTGYSMNDIARGDFTGEERMQMAQLIGYSVSGYGDLSYASRESVAKADAAAESLAAQAKQDK